MFSIDFFRTGVQPKLSLQKCYQWYVWVIIYNISNMVIWSGSYGNYKYTNTPLRPPFIWYRVIL